MLPTVTDPVFGVFAVCVYMVFIILAIEGFTAIMGATVSSMLDGIFDADVDFDVGVDTDIFHTSLHWLMIGKIPIMVHVIIFLSLFASVGFITQVVTNTLLGFYWPSFVAIIVSGVGAIVLSKPIVAFMAKIMPKVETSAIHISELVGSQAIVSQGNATDEISAEARVTDRHGNVHLVRVKPIDHSQSYSVGTVITLSSFDGNTFRVK